MKTISQHIEERLQLNKDRIRHYEYFPETKKELGSIMDEIIKQNINKKIIDLNIIDTSKITDMGGLFYYDNVKYDISQWNVSNVENMESMFYYTKHIDCDISSWDVSHVENMSCMFTGSYFNGDISRWNVSHVKDMSGMFRESKFNQDISKWDVSNVIKMDAMFAFSKFNNDISQWNISNVKNMKAIFFKSKFNQDLTLWKSKITDRDQLQYIQDYIK